MHVQQQAAGSGRVHQPQRKVHPTPPPTAVSSVQHHNHKHAAAATHRQCIHSSSSGCCASLSSRPVAGSRRPHKQRPVRVLATPAGNNSGSSNNNGADDSSSSQVVLDSSSSSGDSSSSSLVAGLSQRLFQGGGIFKGATLSLSSTDEDNRVTLAALDAAAAAAGAGGGGSGGGGDGAQQQQVVIPRHWEEQIKNASLGRRRVMQRYVAQVAEINRLEPFMRGLSDAQLGEQTLRFKAALERNRNRLSSTLDDLLPEAFATVREASRRVLGMRHFDSQLVGGMVLHEGQIAEMATGEGKTLVAVLAAYLNALPGTLTNPPVFSSSSSSSSDGGVSSNSSSVSAGPPKRPHTAGVHVVTVNDYLAARDAEWMGKVYRFLGLTVGTVQSNTGIEAAQAAYGCHITYVTGQELCFNYLKDNTAQTAAELMLPDQLGFAIVDEVDSILIDESRNPMIISQPRGDNGALVITVDKAVRQLWALIQRSIEGAVSRSPSRPRNEVEAEAKWRYLVLDTKQRSLSLTQEGMALLFNLLLQEPDVVFRSALREGRPPCMMDLWEDDVPWGNMAITALKAYQYFNSGVQYIVRDGAVVIVDESTGRVRPISRYSGGLHQAIEAKEGVEVKPDSHATASITFQVFFRFYQKLSGMTGTAKSAAAEFYEIYGLRVVPIPTNKPPRRKDMPLRLYYTEKDKLAYVVSAVESCWAAGRPVLIGTSSVNESELVLRVLQDWCSPPYRPLAARVQLLNAKPENVRLEAQVVAQAGLPAAVTIATNMAGRGTDIILGGNPEGLTRMGLKRYILRRLIPGLHPATNQTPLGGAEAAAQACELDSLCPAMPLDVFRVYDADEVSQVKPRTAEDMASGLPRDLHLSLLAGMMLAELLGKGLPPEQGVAFDDIRQLATAALSAADVVRRITLRQLKETFGHTKLRDLDFSTVVAPKAEALFDELAEVLAPYYMGANAPLAAEDGMMADDEAADPDGDDDGDEGDGSSSSSAAAARRRRSRAAGGVFARLGPALEQLQQFVSKAALLLWLWFDQQCEVMAQEVVDAGGLLVLGTSLQEGERIELQLRGRAGRQGDPGTTQLMFDVGDPLITNYGMQSFQQLAGGLLSSGQLLPYQESVVVDMLHKEVQRSMENQWQMARLETKRYDEVLEVYRRNLYSLRRLILTGDNQQRNSVMHMFIQQWVDQLVARFIDPAAGPQAWTRESLDAATALFGAQGGATGGVGGSGSGSSSSSSAVGSLLGSSRQQQQQQSSASSSSPSVQQQQQPGSSSKVSPLGALIWHIHRLVNPPEMVNSSNKMQVEFKTLVDGVAYDSTAQTLMQLGQQQQPQQPQQQQQQQRIATVPLQISELQVLSPEQIQQLAAYLVSGQPLSWPQPRFEVSFKTQLAFAAHARLFGTPATEAYNSSSSSSWSASEQQQQEQQEQPLRLPEEWCLPQGVLATQRPPVKGRYAAKVCVLRNYLGTALLHAYELRHLSLKKLLVAQSAAAGAGAGGGAAGGMLDLDADLYLTTYSRSVMLEWVDALWSCFLEDVEKMRHAVGLKAYSSQQPLDEFRLEANRAFLLLLDTYRDAVVARLMVPDLNFSLLLGQPQQELLGDALLSAAPDVQQQQQQPASNGLPSLLGQQQHQQQEGGSSSSSVDSASSNGSSKQLDDRQPAATSAGHQQPSSANS